LANDNGCKYTEVSAILNHKVDDLLVGIVKQIRLSADQQRRQRKAHHHHHWTRTGIRTVLAQPFLSFEI